ncbi:MAG: sugar transferase, partial [Selenomonadaceae bacterium]|nr:sugar transferase [Selenomonadaceae bacterium]
IREYYMVRPGITGMWQTSGRSDTTYEERVQMDTWYVRDFYGIIMISKGRLFSISCFALTICLT